MALHESVAGTPLTLSQTTVGEVLRRSAEWTKEIPSLVKGLAKLAAPFRWHFAVIFGFNTAIALWETVQPFILAWGVDTFGEKAPYLEIVAIIVFPVLAIGVPHGIVLPLCRDIYAAWFVKPRFEKHAGLLCLAQDRSPGRSLEPELVGRKAPVAQEGRDAAYQLIDMLLRDPAFALRGVIVMAVLFFKSPTLLALLCVGILADLWVTLLMDARLFSPYAAKQAHQFRVRGLEYRLLDSQARPVPGPVRNDELAACEREWDDYVTVARFVETRRIFYQLPVREGISLIVRIGIMMMVGWWVHIGQVSIGEYILFTQLAGRANDPLYVFFGMQQQIMTTRESLRRLGLLCGIDFGIKRPEAAPAA